MYYNLNMSLNENEIGDIIIDTAVKLHKDLGGGLLESVSARDNHINLNYCIN